jgi:hypothetical protein
LGLSYSHDDVGRTGLDRARWLLMQRGGLQAGATVVVDQSTIAGLQIDADIERGYLAKPYRYVPLFAPGSGGNNLPAGAPVGYVNQIREDARALERLPEARDRYALTGRIARRFDRFTLRLDERGYTDSWGMWASTTDARAIVDIGQRVTLTPHLRFHAQTAVSFWQRAYEIVVSPEGKTGLPHYRAGDRELSWLSTVTVGAAMRLRLTSSVHSPWFLSVQVEGAQTRYPDTLYIQRRWSLFSNLALGAEWN